MRQFFLNFVIFFVGFAYAHLPVLGPNIEYGILGTTAPAGLRGAFVSQINANFGFEWIEPLGSNGYGAWEPNKTNYIKFLAGAELSPFYGTVMAGIGFAPLPPPFAILELRFVYANENLFWTDVEMAMREDYSPPINKSWNAGYIFDSFYKNSSYSQIQSFDTQLGLNYYSSNIDVAFWFHFVMIDIASDYDEKSFDYMRNIPLYSRDYLIISNLNTLYRFGNSFAWGLDVLSMLSGKQLHNLTTPFKSTKEPLRYRTILTGPLLMFNEGKSYFSLKTGFFTRRDSDNTFNDSIKERILLSLQYKYFWNFGFGK